MLSAKDSVEIGSANRYVALYKGLKVAVNTVDKPEISLTRQDLVELVNVCSFYRAMQMILLYCEQYQNMLEIRREVKTQVVLSLHQTISNEVDLHTRYVTSQLLAALSPSGRRGT